MAGFGLSSYFSSSSDKKSLSNGTSSSSKSDVAANGSAPQINSIPLPKPNDTRLPNQPAKVKVS